MFELIASEQKKTIESEIRNIRNQILKNCIKYQYYNSINNSIKINAIYEKLIIILKNQ